MVQLTKERLLRSMLSLGHSDFRESLSEYIQNTEPHAGVMALMGLVDAAPDPAADLGGGFDQLVQTHGEGFSILPRVCLRRRDSERLLRLRSAVQDPEYRLLLALLLVAESPRSLLNLMEARGERSGVEQLALWAVEIDRACSTSGAPALGVRFDSETRGALEALLRGEQAEPAAANRIREDSAFRWLLQS